MKTVRGLFRVLIVAGAIALVAALVAEARKG